MIAQTRDLGVPAVLLHCAMHSFRKLSPSQPYNPIKLMNAEWAWKQITPALNFPIGGILPVLIRLGMTCQVTHHGTE